MIQINHSFWHAVPRLWVLEVDNGYENPIACASRFLAPVKKKYLQIDKEGLAIVFAVQHFNQYLMGQSFTIYSDHKPL